MGGPKNNVLAEALLPRSASFPAFSPVAPRILWFSQEFPSSEKSLGFSTACFPLLMQHFLRFSTVLALLRQEYWSDTEFPKFAYKHTTCTSRICKNLQIF